MKSNLESTSSATTRTGKIARLPQAIRQQLNERLADGEPHQNLVAWLKANGHVQDRLSEFFDGEGEKSVPVESAETENSGRQVQSNRA